jgi:carbon-monoxide dehydrogenase small subunit
VTEPEPTSRVQVSVNGRDHDAVVTSRTTAADFLRDTLGLTGTNLGCEHGVCGACTVLLDGRAVRSCLMYAPQLDGREVTTVEGLEGPIGEFHPLQSAFRENHALQCGFCTPGMLMTAFEYLSEVRGPDEAEVRSAMSGNLCRCTGYNGIVRAVMDADAKWRR